VTHLSTEQIAQWVAGQWTPEAELHVAGCAQCRAQLSEFEEVLAQFGMSVRSVAPPPVTHWQRRLMWPRFLAVAAAGALLLVPVYRERQVRERAALERQDAQLLQQVDSEISRAVPGAMDPLVKMESWNLNEAQK